MPDSADGDLESAVLKDICPYFLVPFNLSLDLEHEDSVRCIETWGENLYIGTKLGELLHFVLLPQDDDSQSTYVLASRQQLSSSTDGKSAFGVRKIAVCGDSGYACVLCDETLTFALLPELTPAPAKAIQGCTWLDGPYPDQSPSDGIQSNTIALSTRTRIMTVLLRKDARPQRLKNVPFSGCKFFVIRGQLACIAEENAYSLLDLENNQSFTLFPISTLSEAASGTKAGGSENENELFESKIDAPDDTQKASAQTDENVNAESSTTTAGQPTAPQSPKPDDAKPKTDRSQQSLTPQIVAMPEEDFFLTTGTSWSESAVGIFVNQEGEVVRGTLEIDRYPAALIHLSDEATKPQTSSSLLMATSNDSQLILEMYDAQELRLTSKIKHQAGGGNLAVAPTLHHLPDAFNLTSTNLSDFLCLRILTPVDAESTDQNRKASIAIRAAEESAYAQSLAKLSIDNLCSMRDTLLGISLLPKPLLLDQAISRTLQKTTNERRQQAELMAILRTCDKIEATSEAEFIGLQIIRQKICLLLFKEELHGPSVLGAKKTVDLLAQSAVDPRLIISIFPILRSDIMSPPEGFWAAQAVRDVLDSILPVDISTQSGSSSMISSIDFIRTFLLAWRGLSDLASIADQTRVSMSIDQALVHLLLHLDSDESFRSLNASSELANLIADIRESDHIVQLFENYNSLYLLSRYYHVHKQPQNVLKTWQRMMESDNSTDFPDGEHEMKKYLVRLKDRALVLEYALWLTKRNTKLGIEVFADSQARVKFLPQETIPLLKEHAPQAVKDYLDHLIFVKQQYEYSDMVIAYYVDVVTDALESSETNREICSKTYVDYQNLPRPRASYFYFVKSLPHKQSWWRDRLKLLELLGGNHDIQVKYDPLEVLKRLESFEEFLVPELISLDGRQGNHAKALRLLVHMLGDQHAAIWWCLSGGQSMFQARTAMTSAVYDVSYEEQLRLFAILLRETMNVKDEEMRKEATQNLLSRFARWFDASEVLEALPLSWDLDIINEFMTIAFRNLHTTRNESMIRSGLTQAYHLIQSYEIMEKMSSFEPTIEVEAQTAS